MLLFFYKLIRWDVPQKKMSDVDQDKADDKLLYGYKTRQAWELFNKYRNNNNVIPLNRIRKAFNSINLYPTQSQIYEYVHCACEVSGKNTVDHLTFGEFAFFVNELQQQYSTDNTQTLPRSHLKEKAVEALNHRRLQRRFSGHAAGFQVFLGGSCNPTTWRTDIAIPFLKKHGITYYNPQVCNWKPNLMELEDQAKQTAQLLFFVIDNKTRSSASMVEVAYIAGCDRQLILVVKKFQPPVYIYGELLRQSELDDLERSHAYLIDLSERMGIPVFNDICTALNCTKKVITQQIKVSDLTVADGAQPVKHPHLRIANELLSIKEVFNTVDSCNAGRLSFDDTNLAFRTVTSDNLPSNLYYLGSFTFEQFCCLLTEYRYKKKNIFQILWSFLWNFPSILLHWLGWTSIKFRADGTEPRRRDIFLGGSCGASAWRESIAIPILRKNGISYFNPQVHCWNAHCIPREASIKDSCLVLLYVITQDTRAMTSMLEAGYFIGKKCNVILCIEFIKTGAVIDGEKLSDNEVLDYNRSRAYLADVANRDGVPVFDDVEEAVLCAVNRFREAL
ncbi:hypothetical protein HELRODRAFT_185164 [Helobdella robusta]|uniref:Uncharacterized protein n=1 Tax=Helobdella robusta TaxID=6412 RepID=T1FMG7_HELRO|nr:hypothetical protein HELRODRAFT_185164 [Helobdella robusta]ESN92803.1 hypothetical protein HELRODRAFT_185164 [Helobdella robusta]